jgi:heme exporter protein B
VSRFLGDALDLATALLRSETRARGAIVAAAALGGASLLVVGIAAGPDPAVLRALAPALAWIALLAASLAIADRLDQLDRRDDAFSALWLVLADRRSLFAGRLLALAALIAALQTGLWILAAILLDVSPGPLWLGFVPLIGATSLALGGGCLLAVSIAGASPARTLLLPVVLLPLAVPTLVAGIESSTALLAAAPGPAAAWLGVALLEAALFAGLGLLGFEALAAPE